MPSPEEALERGRRFDPDCETFVVRLWDGFDGVWTDVSDPLDAEGAKAEWARLTKNGTRATSYNDIDYYAIYPTSRRMLWSEGRSQTRGTT